MTKRELLELQIKSQTQWIEILLDERYTDDELNLPQHLTRKKAIDIALDNMLFFRNQLKNLNHD